MLSLFQAIHLHILKKDLKSGFTQEIILLRTIPKKKEFAIKILSKTL